MTDQTPPPPPNPAGPPGGGGRGPSIIPIARESPECDGCFSLVLNQFAESFDKSAKRWELIVYPSLFAFIVLAMYGFFLIYSLTQDIRTMAVSIDPKMGVNMGILSNSIGRVADNIEVMSTHLEYISDNMETMSVDVQTLSENVDGMAANVNSMSQNMVVMTKLMDNIAVKLNTLGPIAANMNSMNQSMNLMTNSMGRMGHEMGGVTRPMSFINRFMPWGN